MKLELGKIPQQFVTLPKLMVSVHLRPEPYLSRFWRHGQLYRGYWGVHCFLGRIHFTLWVHHMEA